MRNIKIKILDKLIKIKFDDFADLIDVLSILKSIDSEPNIIIDKVILCETCLGFSKKNNITHYMGKNYLELDFFLKKQIAGRQNEQSSHIFETAEIKNLEIQIYTMNVVQNLPKIKRREELIEEIIKEFYEKTKKNY